MKTWITEVASLGAVTGAIDAVTQILTSNPIIPAPWGTVVLAGCSFLTLVLRTIDKQRAKKA